MDGHIPLNNHISIEEAHRIIDETIERHQEIIERQASAISTLNSQRNTFAPVSRIPPEILSRIFVAVKTSFSKEYHSRSNLSWIKVTHVNRYWRNVAIASPTLWTFIDDSVLYNLPWLEETLSRSKQARLSIRARVNHLPLSDVWKLALEHSQRIKALSIRIDTAEWLKMQDLLPKSVPQLEYLDLSGSSPMRLKPVFPPEEVLNETPKLQQLALTNVEIKWGMTSYLKPRTLTHLKLHDLSPNSRPTWKQLLDALKRIRNLKVLDLKDALPLPIDEQLPPASDPIYLPSLQTLLLDCSELDAKEAKACLSYITFPFTTSVRILCANGQFSALDIVDRLPDFLVELAKLFPNAYPDTYPRTLILFQDYSSLPEVRLKIYTEALADEQILAHKHIDPRLELALQFPPFWSFSVQKDVADITNAVFDSALPMQNISRVCLTGMLMEYDPIALANAVGKLPQLRFVMATKNTHRALVDLLQLGLSVDTTTDQGEDLYFPNLSSIYLYGMSLWEGREDHYNEQHTISVEQLYECLARRRKIGTEIKRLTLKAYPLKLDKDDMELLSGIVNEVDSDHKRFNPTFGV